MRKSQDKGKSKTNKMTKRNQEEEDIPPVPPSHTMV
jgi:hypothetical protein